ncbi:PQQ-binding-like beta-propeller repeat protein [candidate division KSB1 bacterium]|nr:PQQ-binding-like beta-propeller repeat protein [candidate division KSB1 bacterium]
MKLKYRFIVALILICVICVIAQDWPQWRGVNRDGRVTGFIAPETWPAELTKQWAVTVGKADATPALVGNILFVFTRQGDEEVISGLNADNGKQLWENRYKAPEVTGPARSHPGPRSTPAVADGRVVILGASGILSCLDAASGKLVWRKDDITSVPQYFTGMSPIIVDGLCIAHLGGKDDGAVIAFDLLTGKEKWKWTGDGPAYASPVLMTAGDTKQLVLQAEKNLISLAVADGKMLWQIPTPPERRFYNSASPVVDGQTVYYTGQGLGIRAVNIEKQGDKFIVKEFWNNEELGTSFNTPVLKDGLLYGLEKNRGFLYAIDAKTGQTAWTDSVQHNRFGSIVDAGTVLMALSAESQLIVFKPDPGKYNELALYKVSDTPVYAHPVIAGNRVYIKDEDTLALWTIK